MTEKIEEKQKQYLLMADQMTMALLSRLIPGMQFVEVEGIGMKDNPDYKLLANPVEKPKAEPEVLLDEGENG